MRIVDSSRASSGLLLVLCGLGANLVIYLLTSVLNRVVPGFWNSTALVFALCWFGTAALIAVGFGRAATAVDPPGLLWATVALIAVSSVVELSFELLFRFGDGRSTVGRYGMVLLSLVERGCIVWVLASLARPRHAWAIAVGGVVLVLTFARTALQVVVSSGLVAPDLRSGGLYGLVMPAIGFINSAALAAIAFAAFDVARETVTGATPLVPPNERGLHGPPVEATPASPAADFAIGTVALVIGLGVTAISVQAASNGGRYVVATGAIAVGVVRIIRGLVRLARR